MGAALVLFLTPINFKERKFVVRHEQVEQLPWGILLLFGGGLRASRMRCRGRGSMCSWGRSSVRIWAGCR